MKFFLCVIGMVLIVEGFPYFAFPSKMKEAINMILHMDDDNLRKVGFFLILSGFLIIYLVMGGD